MSELEDQPTIRLGDVEPSSVMEVFQLLPSNRAIQLCQNIDGHAICIPATQLDHGDYSISCGKETVYLRIDATGVMLLDEASYERLTEPAPEEEEAFDENA